MLTMSSTKSISILTFLNEKILIKIICIWKLSYEIMKINVKIKNRYSIIKSCIQYNWVEEQRKLMSVKKIYDVDDEEVFVIFDVVYFYLDTSSFRFSFSDKIFIIFIIFILYSLFFFFIFSFVLVAFVMFCCFPS